MNNIQIIQDEFRKSERSAINQLVKEIQSLINLYDANIKVEASYSTANFQIKYLDYSFNFYIFYESSGHLYLRGRKPFSYHRDYDKEKEMNKAYQYVRNILVKALSN